LVTSLVPHSIALTGLRVVAPAGAAWCIWAATQQPDGDSVLRIAGFGWMVPVLALVFAAETGAWFVNGPAYPNERRFALKPPGPVLFGPLPLAWALAVGAPTAGALLLAGGSYVLGGVILVVGTAASAVLLRALHGLARRWVVFVPAGFVLHDPLALVDPVLFRRKEIEALRAAPAGSPALDLTKGALGLALELMLLEKVPMALVKPGQALGEQGASAQLMFSPSRPGQVLAEAKARRLPVG
ncbi:MAG: hypothetical protein ACLGHT_04035, partial [Acidimicrobiia bacterium]